MKRMVSLLLCALLALSLAGCGSSEEQREAMAILRGTSSEHYALSTGTAIEPVTLVDEQDVVVRLAGVRGDPGNPELVLAVENGRREDIHLDISRMTVNGWMLDCWCDLYEVEGHSVELGLVSCYGERPSLGPGEDLISLELEVTLLDEDYDELYISPVLSIPTDSPQTELDFTVPEGVTLLDTEDVLVIATGFEEIYGEEHLVLYLENRSGRALILESGEALLNGEELGLWIWSDVAAGSRRMVYEDFYYSWDDWDDYAPPELSPEDVITLELIVLDYDSYRAVAEDTVTLSPSDF